MIETAVKQQLAIVFKEDPDCDAMEAAARVQASLHSGISDLEALKRLTVELATEAVAMREHVDTEMPLTTDIKLDEVHPTTEEAVMPTELPVEAPVELPIELPVEVPAVDLHERMDRLVDLVGTLTARLDSKLDALSVFLAKSGDTPKDCTRLETAFLREQLGVNTPMEPTEKATVAAAATADIGAAVSAAKGRRSAVSVVDA